MPQVCNYYISYFNFYSAKYIYNMKVTILVILSVQFMGIKYIHNAVSHYFQNFLSSQTETQYCNINS